MNVQVHYDDYLVFFNQKYAVCYIKSLETLCFCTVIIDKLAT